MRKIKLFLVLLISIFTFNLKVFAGANLSVSSSNVTVGSNFTVYVNMSGAAAWNIHVNPSGPVSGCIINQANATEDAQDTSKTFSASCTATGVGTITLTLSGDITSATNGLPVKIFGTSKVNVTQPTTTTTTTTKPPVTTTKKQEVGTTKNDNKKTTTKDNKTTTTKKSEISENNNLKDIIVEGQKLTKVDNNNYTLTVANNITSINLKVTPEDNKAKVKGDGSHTINIGENNIEVIITSESGKENKINIKITRKDGYYLEDLDSIVKDKNIKDADVIIDENSKISKDDILKIKNSKKIIRLNYYDKDKKLIYSWTINGKEIKDENEFITTITKTSENIEKIYKLSNYADGLYINFEHTGKLPKGTKIKLYVGDKFKNNSMVNVYYHNNEKQNLDFIEGNLKVQEGYIEFNIEHCSDYFVTMSNLNNCKNIKETKSSFNVFIIISIIEFIIIVIFLLLHIFNRKKAKNVEFIDFKDRKNNEEKNEK